jgi:alkyldihydroxyacetonephosphate synthase
MRWWGWGDPARSASLDPGTLGYLRETLALAGRPRPPVALEQVALEPSTIGSAALGALGEIVGAEHVRTGHADRVRHAAGKGYPDLVRLRAGRPEAAPDAIAYPGSREQLSALLRTCAEQSIAVVPFGGGTSVVGGVAPLRGEQRAVLTLDLKRLDELVRLDRHSRTVTVGAGMRAVELERELKARQLTLGHFPQSFEYVSLGGCAATRSAGQASTGYGRFERMVLGLSLRAPAGSISTSAVPASAAGPNLRELLVGSEGALGAIDELTLRVRAAPEERLCEGVFFEAFEQGVDLLRELAQSGLLPEVARLSDAHETSVSLQFARHGGLLEWLGRRYLGARGYGRGCLAIFGFEGQRGMVRARRRRVHSLVRARGGLPVGQSPGKAWQASRFAAPYLRDELLTHGVLVETLETASSWSNLIALHGRVRSAIADALHAWGTPGLVGCHVSHVYETGASLYFTLLAPQAEGREIEQWQVVKRAASDAVVEGGGTISHHHAVGRDHVPWIERELGHDGLDALRALKDRLDPAGIMNPGKLLG